MTPECRWLFCRDYATETCTQPDRAGRFTVTQRCSECGRVLAVTPDSLFG